MQLDEGSLTFNANPEEVSRIHIALIRLAINTMMLLFIFQLFYKPEIIPEAIT